MTRCMETVSGKNSRIAFVPIEITTACPLKRRVLIEKRGESSAVEGKQGDCKIKKGWVQGNMIRLEGKDDGIQPTKMKNQ